MVALVLATLAAALTPDGVTVSIGGEVAQPGNYSLSGAVKVLDALARAGGALADSGDYHRVVLKRSRNNEQIPIDLARMLGTGNLSQNFVLRDGDSLYIPRLERRYVWLNAGKEQFQLPYENGLTLGEALIKMGWCSGGAADLVRLERPGASPESPSQLFEYPADAIHVGPNAPATIPLRDGDILFVGKGTLRAPSEPAKP